MVGASRACPKPQPLSPLPPRHPLPASGRSSRRCHVPAPSWARRWSAARSSWSEASVAWPCWIATTPQAGPGAPAPTCRGAYTTPALPPSVVWCTWPAATRKPVSRTRCGPTTPRRTPGKRARRCPSREARSGWWRSTVSWAPRAQMPTPREHLAVVASDGRIYAIGGRASGDEGERFAAAAEVYDIVTDQWKTLPELPTPRGGFPGVFTQGQVVVLGGERGTRAFDTVEAYDPARGEWRALPPMPTARHGLAAVVIGGAIYAIGGSTQARVAENTGANEAIRANPPT